MHTFKTECDDLDYTILVIGTVEEPKKAKSFLNPNYLNWCNVKIPPTNNAIPSTARAYTCAYFSSNITVAINSTCGPSGPAFYFLYLSKSCDNEPSSILTIPALNECALNDTGAMIATCGVAVPTQVPEADGPIATAPGIAPNQSPVAAPVPSNTPAKKSSHAAVGPILCVWALASVVLTHFA